MKNIIRNIIIMSLAMFTLQACEPSHLEDNLLASTVYFSKTGVQDISFYDVDGTYDHAVYAVNAGYYEGDASLSVTTDQASLDAYNQKNNLALKALPADCYKISVDENQIAGEKRSAKFTVQFDCEQLRSLSKTADYSDLKEYVVPLLLQVQGDIAANESLDRVFLRPDMKPISVQAVSPGEVTVDKNGLQGTLTFDFPVKTSIENRWETTFNILTGADAINRVNTSLVSRGKLQAYSLLNAAPEEAYTINFEPNIAPGTSTSTMTVSVNSAKIPQGMSSIVLWLDGATILGQQASVTGTPYMVINLENIEQISTVGKIAVTDRSQDQLYMGKYLESSGYHVLPREGWKFEPESSQGTSYLSVLDNNTNSFWENRYNDAAGSYGPKSTLPFGTILDLGKVSRFSAIELWKRSHDNYVSDLQEFEIYISNDRQNWTFIKTVAFGTRKDERAHYILLQSLEARYVNLYMTKSNRSNAVNIAELFLWDK